MANFTPQIDDLTIYHNGDYEVSMAALLDKALNDAAAAAAAAVGTMPKAAQFITIDLDEMRQTGFFHGYATPNAPENGFMYYIIIAYPDGYNFWTKQMAFSFATNKAYIRTMANGEWSAWELLTNGNLAADIATVANALASHNHDGVYAPAAHNHDGSYAPVSHNHDGVYSPVSHDHSGTYAPASHTHSQYLTSVPNFSTNAGETMFVVGANRNYKTVQALLDSLPKVAAGQRTIQIDAGDYPEKILLKGFHGGAIKITTSSAYAGRANLLGVLLEDCTATVTVSGINIQPVGGQNPSHGVYPTRCSVVKVEDCAIQTVAFGVYAVRTDKIAIRNTTVSAIGGNLTAGIGMAESEGTTVALDGLTVNGSYGSTAIQAQNAFIVGKRPVMNSIDVELNSNAGGVYYNVQ